MKNRNIENSSVKNKKRHPFRTILIVLAVFLLVFMPVSNAAGYEVVFRFLFTESEVPTVNMADYPGMTVTDHTFETNKNRTLAGFAYDMDIDDPNGVIVLSHGIGTAHEAYTDLIYSFLKEGYLVFSYDAWSFGKSGGTYTGGLPQGVIDLDHALDFVETLPEYDGLEITLVGHSWGAYAAGSVLNEHDEISTVVMLSAFNASSDMLRQRAEQFVGPVVNFLLPYVKAYEAAKFGHYSTDTAVSGIKNSSANVLIIQGTDDTTVLTKYGIDIFTKKLSDNSRVTLMALQGEGHSPELTGELLNEILSFIREK